MVTIKNMQNLRKNLNNYVALVVCVFAFAGAANDAHALDFGCRDKDQIKAELMAENQVPVVRFYQDATMNSKKSEFEETFFTMNPQTREGYRMDRGYGPLSGQMCISAKFTDIRLYNPQTLDQRAYLDSADADKKGSGINNIIYGRSQVYGDNPIFRASEYSPIHQSTRITYVTSNPLKGNEGQVIVSSLDGVYDKKFTKKSPINKAVTPMLTMGRYLPMQAQMLPTSKWGNLPHNNQHAFFLVTIMLRACFFKSATLKNKRSKHFCFF